MAAAVVGVHPFHNNNNERHRDDSNGNGNELMNLFESCTTSFFGPCEDTCQQASRTVFWDASSPLTASSHSNNNRSTTDRERIQCLDFETLHDQFLESLLHEAAALRGEAEEDARESGSQYTHDSSRTGPLLRKDSSMSEETGLGAGRKRRRPIKLSRRRTPPRIRKQQQHHHHAPSDAHSNASTEEQSSSRSSSASITISLSELGKVTNLPQPETYLHALVRMQKDKGKGEPVGSNLCAKGRDACLEKLRDKMRLLTEVATEGARMKVRLARVSARVENFVETRSLIHLRMGFLSMTYGILLRWDTTKTGTVALVVLRKMCHESFYPDVVPRIPSSVSTASQHVNPPRDGASQRIPTAPVQQQKLVKKEFIDLEPPYCVHPPKFPSATLSVTVVSVTGVSKKSNWMACLSIDDSTENVPLVWDSSKRFLCPKSPTCTLSLATGNRVRWGSTSAVQIKLFENRMRRRMSRRMTDTLTVPLTKLLPQRSPARPARIMIPCTHEPNACVVVDVTWQSDYAIWVTRELQARQSAVQPPPAAAVPDPVTMTEAEEELENQYPWDWICLVC